MEDNLELLLDDLLEIAATQDRYILALTGSPAVGKSTLADRLVGSINANGLDQAIALPMDGYHFSNEKLLELELLELKGIPETFDAKAFVELVKSIKSETELTHWAPEFRRELEASIQNAIAVQPHHKIIIVEGNYLLLESAPWNQLADYFDKVWFLSLEDSIRKQRLLARHMSYGQTESEAREKMKSTDDKNALLIEASKSRADRVVVLPVELD